MSSRIQENRVLAFFQLVVYLLLTPFAFFVLFQVLRLKRFCHAMGWFWLTSFLALLLVASGLTIGAGLQSISTTGLILSAIGIAPLFLLVDSVLNEAVYNTSVAGNLILHLTATILFHIDVVTAAILVAIGASKLFSSTATPTAVQTGSHLVKAGILLFLVSWVWLVVTTAVALTACRQSAATKKILIAVVISMPLLLVRNLFGIFEFFLTSSSVFNPIDASILARLFMSVLPMMGVAIVTTVAGVFTYLRRPTFQNEPSRIPLETPNEIPK